MMNGAAFDYKFGNKAQWRRTILNRIVERLPCRPCDAVMLYLAGEQDLDREVALRKGFQRNNLIAIERDTSVLSTLRSKSTLVVHGDLNEVLLSWPPDRRVSVVYADFCGGLTPVATRFLTFMCLNQYAQCVFAINMQRGRDKYGCEIVEGNPDVDDGAKFFNISNKHRGLWLYIVWCTMIKLMSQNAPDPEAFPIFAQQFMRPTFLSYQSTTGIMFDSLVLRNPYCFELPPEQDYGKSMAERRRVAAILAHRTMRA